MTHCTDCILFHKFGPIAIVKTDSFRDKHHVSPPYSRKDGVKTNAGDKKHLTGN